MRRAALFLSIALIASTIEAANRRSKKKHTSRTVLTNRTVRSKHAARREPMSRPVAGAVTNVADAAAIAYVRTEIAVTAGSLENAAGLVAFFEQLSHPPASSALHVLQYGDSHTASDDWANAMRMGLQSRFGVGGPGFALAGHPYKGYRRYDVWGESSPGWYTDGLAGRTGDGLYGLGGVSITARAPNETVSLKANCPELQLFYLQQPGGGQLEFLVDGASVQTISTDGPLGPGYFKYESAGGAHQYLLRTLSSAPVRLFGWVTENHSGVTYETLGINGAQARMLLDWNESILASHLAQREPALIVLAYGTNEAISPRWSADAYRAAFMEVLNRFSRATPTASILVVGPPDCEMRAAGRLVPYPHLTQVVEIQRQVAYEQGCAFWDWRARMGGPGAVGAWANAGLSQPDRVHLTMAGYRMLGDLLVNE
ncbi:MAG: GDSL-type esterase/lipase family protein, partial [Acidobacteriota bacterium]|nr:GDSL-type esterase/lipase family protein [Acidobacteriota bacterium]